MNKQSLVRVGRESELRQLAAAEKRVSEEVKSHAKLEARQERVRSYYGPLIEKNAAICDRVDGIFSRLRPPSNPLMLAPKLYAVLDNHADPSNERPALIACLRIGIDLTAERGMPGITFYKATPEEAGTVANLTPDDYSNDNQYSLLVPDMMSVTSEFAFCPETDSTTTQSVLNRAVDHEKAAFIKPFARAINIKRWEHQLESFETSLGLIESSMHDPELNPAASAWLGVNARI